jgi:hypothetical protein
MKKFIFSIFVAGFVLAGTASAQGMMGTWQNTGTTTQFTQDANISAALQDIYKNQNVSSQSQLDCAKVSDDQFEKLGDAYMEAVHPGQAHTYMEQMMGGEGSATLKTAHVNMGRAYLGCWSNYNATPLTMPMMGGFGMMFNSSSNNNPASGWGMMGRNFGNGWNMMGGYGSYGLFGWITMILVWVLLILGIVALVKWLGKNK